MISKLQWVHPNISLSLIALCNVMIMINFVIDVVSGYDVKRDSWTRQLCFVVFRFGGMARDLLDSFSMKTWRCSWSLAATIASALALVSVVHLFLFPLTPSLNYFNLASDSCISTNASAELISKRGWEWDEPAIDLKRQFLADSHDSVSYKGAPWKAEIGRWLAGCDSITKEVNISEVATLFC